MEERRNELSQASHTTDEQPHGSEGDLRESVSKPEMLGEPKCEENTLRIETGGGGEATLL